ncbi:uncharacterized protein N7525_009425 [Penicillium rubens]|uniref:uncharacterized protein n=1 Tax=Penicillium rubens TaxID=1108849 RepID=UPI002A59AC40|nr:uncharacterized protein N7525_009425 [Penicillium rubens]KAJ5831172.1 hypothetical protein N7525_009425 [Penicillium rubens]
MKTEQAHRAGRCHFIRVFTMLDYSARMAGLNDSGVSPVSPSCIWATFSAFGFVNTYEQTIYLRQVQLPNGQWVVEYSPVIHATDAYKPAGSQGHGSGLSVSQRQCMFTSPCLRARRGP